METNTVNGWALSPAIGSKVAAARAAATRMNSDAPEASVIKSALGRMERGRTPLVIEQEAELVLHLAAQARARAAEAVRAEKRESRASRESARRERQLERAAACQAARGSNPAPMKYGGGKKRK